MTGNLAAILGAVALIAAAVVRRYVRLRREDAAWRAWMRATDQALDVARATHAADYREWAAELRGNPS